jgi:hypothetical protein
MNIDERLEALTHSVELLASLHRNNEKRMERLDQHMENFAEEIEATRQAKPATGFVVDIAEGTARLLRAVETHEQRISDLEGKQSQ